MWKWIKQNLGLVGTVLFFAGISVAGVSITDVNILAIPEQSSVSDTPISGKRFLYAKSDGIYHKNSAGTEVQLSDTFDGPLDLENYSIATSVTSSALTITVNDGAGSALSSSSPFNVGFNDGDGTYTVRSVTSSPSVTLSSGSTIGHTDGNDRFIYVYAVDNSGTITLAVSSFRFDDGSLQSVTAEGGAGAADDGYTLYGPGALSSKPVRLLGRITSNQTTAGTWGSAPTTIALLPFNDPIVAARGQNTSGPSYANNTQSVIATPTINYDTTGSLTTGGVFTCPIYGIYLVEAHVLVSQSTDWDLDEPMSLHLQKNGTDYAILNRPTGMDSSANQFYSVQGSVTVECDKDDTLEVDFYQSSGATLSFLASSSTYNWVSFTRIK